MRRSSRPGQPSMSASEVPSVMLSPTKQMRKVAIDVSLAKGSYACTVSSWPGLTRPSTLRPGVAGAEAWMAGSGAGHDGMKEAQRDAEDNRLRANPPLEFRQAGGAIGGEVAFLPPLRQGLDQRADARARLDAERQHVAALQ